MNIRTQIEDVVREAFGDPAFRLASSSRTAARVFYGFDEKTRRVQSCAIVEDQGKAVHVHTLATAKDYRRRGMCPRLVAAIVNSYPEKMLYLSVDATNAAALRCYEKTGFVALRQSAFRRRDASLLYWMARPPGSLVGGGDSAAVRTLDLHCATRMTRRRLRRPVRK